MREFVLLDSGPLGHACRRPGTPGADQCLLWIDALIARGVEVVVSEIADYEVRRAGLPRHFFLSFLRFSIVTNYCTCRLYLLMMTKATANIVKRCDDVPQKLRFSPNAGFAIRPSLPILMRWPWTVQEVNEGIPEAFGRIPGLRLNGMIFPPDKTLLQREHGVVDVAGEVGRGSVFV